MPNKDIKCTLKSAMGLGFRTFFVSLPLLMASCGSDSGQRTMELGLGESGAFEAVGDWDDLFASVDAVALRHALGVISREENGERAVIRLIDVLGSPILITAERGEKRMSLRVEVGRFGDGSAERRIGADLKHRLGQLHGVDVAPIDWR